MHLAALLACVLAAPGALRAQAPSAGDALFRTVAGLDTTLFDAYNRCDLETLGRLVSDDLEFYHDHDGLSVGRQIFLDSTRRNICGKVRRELVGGTLEVYPIGNFGALEIGVHRFGHPGHDDTEPLGEGKFAIVWQKSDAGWKMTRAISYAHRAVSK